MKKYFLKSVVIIVSLIFAGCGTASIKESEVSSEPEVKVETKTEYVEVEKKVYEYVTEVQAVDSNELTIDTSSELNSSFTESLGIATMAKYPVFLGHTRNLLDKFEWDRPEAECTGIYSSDPEIAIADQYGNVTGLKEGTCEVTFTGKDATGSFEKHYSIYVTTVNDGQDFKSYMSLCDQEKSNVENRQFALNATWIKENINTIQDLIYVINYRGIYYNSEYPVSVDGNFAGWSWASDGDSIFKSYSGVCCDIANAACFALQNDYEDMGVLYVHAKIGHVFNWFYEDGKYIVCDFTNVISDVRDRVYNPNLSTYVKTFDSLEKLTAYIEERYASDDFFAVTMHSTLNNDFLPAVYMSYMSNSNLQFDSEAYIGFEPAVYETMTIMYQNPKYANFSIIEVPYSEIPYDVPLYGEHERYSCKGSSDMWYKTGIYKNYNN